MMITQNEEIYRPVSSFAAAFDMPEFDYYATETVAKEPLLFAPQPERDVLAMDDLMSMPLGFDDAFDCLFGRGDAIAIPGRANCEVSPSPSFPAPAASSFPAASPFPTASPFPSFGFKEEYRIGSPSDSFDDDASLDESSLSSKRPRTSYSSSSASFQSAYAAAPAAPAELCRDPVSRKRERNRLAAERCRQRKADLIGSLQKECEELRRQRERLLEENARLLRALGL